MNSPQSTLICLLALAAGATAAGADALPAAYAPVIAASDQRRAAAEQALADWRAKRDALAVKFRAAEQQLVELAKPPTDAKSDALRERLKTLDAALKESTPVSFTKLSQFANYDQLTDERAAVKSAMQAAERERRTLVRSLARRTVRGAALADECEALESQVIAAGNEATLAQNRRDGVKRAEGGLMNSLQLVAEEGPVETVHLDVPPPPDAAARWERFQSRGSDQGLRELGQRFFSQMTLTLPGLEQTAQAVKEDRYQAALEAYKRYFFAKLLAAKPGDGGAETGGDDESRDGEATLSHTVFPPPTPAHIRQALEGVVVETVPGKKRPVRVEANLGQPGAIPWVFATPDNDVELAFCRRLGSPGATGAALLHSYAIGGPKEHLLRWSEILDDWTLNWQRDVERSPLPVRDYNLLYVCRIQGTRDKLRTIAQMQPSFVDDLPAATLARWLMAMNEEYLSSAIRLGRCGLYNFRIMALNSMLPTSLQMQEFHAHQWAVREGWRQVDNNFIYKIRRDGANFEFANDGHENTDQFLTLPFHALQAWRAQPEWLEPFWAEEFLENFLANARYRVHNLKQDGYCYRLSVRDQRSRYLGANPEYKVNLLDEEEVRRRLWQVFQIGRPEAPPRIHSESLAFQGYYYLRSGWEPDDYFLYFQSIGQPILSGREDNTGFSLYGRGGIFLLSPAPAVDGKVQNIHHGLVMNPGGKAPFMAYGKPDVVKHGRFHAGERFDFAEGAFEGVYQLHRPSDSYDVFGSYGYEASLAKAQAQAQRAGQPFVDEPIRDVRQTRQVLSLRGRETYLVTDIFQSAQPHRFTQNYTIYTPVRLDHLAKRLELLDGLPPFTADTAARTFTTHNIGLPNLQLRHFSALPIEYAVRDTHPPDGDVKQLLKKFSKCDRQQSDRSKAAQFSRQVAVTWQGQGWQVLVTLVMPQGRHYATAPPPATLHDVQPLTPRADTAGFTGKFADGTRIAYLAAAQPRVLKLGSLEATGAALLVAGDSGLALDCTRIAGAVPPVADFTFRIEQGRVVVEQPIYRPIQPVTIEPLANVFTDTATATLACPTPGVEIRYTLDGTRPVPGSPLYAGPFTVDKTCWLKARAFRHGVTEDVWQQDGTHATVVSSAVFRKEPLAPAAAPVRTVPGLKYEYFEGVWTELMARSLTMPAKTTGTVATLLDVSPRQTDGAFGVRYEGFLQVPQDGVYTFHAPAEFLYPDNDCGYDLRVFLDDQEWYPALRWHAHGTWSVALAKGRHPFKVIFVDLRLRPHKIELMWGFPHPDFTWQGTAPALQISGPALPKQSIPETLLSHE